MLYALIIDQVLQLTNHLNVGDEDGLGGLRVETVGRVEDISNVQVNIALLYSFERKLFATLKHTSLQQQFTMDKATHRRRHKQS